MILFIYFTTLQQQYITNGFNIIVQCVRVPMSKHDLLSYSQSNVTWEQTLDKTNINTV